MAMAPAAVSPAAPQNATRQPRASATAASGVVDSRPPAPPMAIIRPIQVLKEAAGAHWPKRKSEPISTTEQPRPSSRRPAISIASPSASP